MKRAYPLPKLRSIVERASSEVISARITRIDGIPTGRAAPIRPIGSGTFVRLGEDVFVLTAHHVSTAPGKLDQFTHRLGDGMTGLPFCGGWVGHPNPDCDLAIWRCFQGVLDEVDDIVPLPAQEIGCSDLDPSALFMVQGFPARSQVVMPAMRQTHSVADSFIGGLRQPTTSNSEHFAIGYGTGVEAQGLSGSAIWNLGVHRVDDLDNWTPNAVTFSGVAHRWDKVGRTIIGTRSELVRDFLQPAAVQSLAMFPEEPA